MNKLFNPLTFRITRPSLRLGRFMNNIMTSTGNYGKIFRSIVISLAIYVMYMFFFFQWSTKKSSHYIAMFCDNFSIFKSYITIPRARMSILRLSSFFHRSYRPPQFCSTAMRTSRAVMSGKEIFLTSLTHFKFMQYPFFFHFSLVPFTVPLSPFSIRSFHINNFILYK